MKLFETCMLEAYDPVVTKRGYHTVKLNPRKARRIRFNQKVQNFFAPMMKVFHKPQRVAIPDEEFLGDFSF